MMRPSSQLPQSISRQALSAARSPAASGLAVVSQKHWKGIALPQSFRPTGVDVMCGRGKDCYNHEGNRRFRRTIEDVLSRYMECDQKHEKGLMVINIVDGIRAQGGGFVRYDRSSRTWFDIGDDAAREKVGQTIREAIVQQDPEKRSRKNIRRAFNKRKRKERAVQSTTTTTFKASPPKKAVLESSNTKADVVQSSWQPLNTPPGATASTSAGSSFSLPSIRLPLDTVSPMHSTLLFNPLLPMYSSQSLLALATARRREEQRLLMQQNPIMLAAAEVELLRHVLANTTTREQEGRVLAESLLSHSL